MSKDFTVTKTARNAKRTFTAPIISKERFDAIIESLTGETNLLGTVSYYSKGVLEPGAKVTKESYRFILEVFDTNTGSVIGDISVSAKNREVLENAAARIKSDATLAGYFKEGAEIYENDAQATWSATIRLHDPTDETYNLTLNRKTLTMTSFEADAILAKVETWADSVPELN